MPKKKSTDKKAPATRLRQRAEQMLQTSRTDIAGMPTADVQSLVHELQVHQIELEIQNEELRQAQIELAESRDRYSDLYEYAPAGYLTLDQQGKILQANLNAAGLLEIDRQKLVGAGFPDFVDREGQNAWHFHRQAVFAGAAKQTCELPLRTAQNQLLWVRLESEVVLAETGGGNQCRTVLLDMTERRQLEQDLRESERRFRAMADDLPLIIWLHGADGRQEFVNQTFCEYFGVTREKTRNGRWKMLVHPDDATYEREFGACVRERRPFHAQVRVKRADGKWRWIESWGRPRFSPDGDYLGHVGGSADITARKKAEDKIGTLNATLEQQVAERTSALAALHDIAAMANEAKSVEEAVLYALRRVSEHNGWSCGHVWLPDCDDPDSLLPAYVWYESATPHFIRLREWILSLRLRRGEGLVGRVSVTGQAEFTNDIAGHLSACKATLAENLGVQTVCAFPICAKEKIVGVVEFCAAKQIESAEQSRNMMASVGALLGRVVEREQASSALRKSEGRLRALLKAAPDAIVSIDGAGLITEVNPAAEQVFGYSAEEMLGQNVSLLMPSPYREEHAGYLTRYLETREPHIIGVGREVQAQCKNGRVFPIELAVNKMDHMELFVGIIRDISHRKELEKQVLEATAEEQRRIGQDIHDGVGQELSGLRYVAQTHAESLSQRASPDAKTAQRMTQWLETVQQQLRAIIRALVPVEVDQHGLVAALRGLAERTAEVHDLDCVLECSQPILVPDAALGTHLYRIVQEAIGNAVRHAQASRVVIRLFEENDTLKLKVTDDGRGIRESWDANIGIGLRSMQYRASLIGAKLDVRRAAEGGTQVTCIVSRGGGGKPP